MTQIDKVNECDIWDYIKLLNQIPNMIENPQINNAEIIKTDDAQIIRHREPNVVKRISDDMLGVVRTARYSPNERKKIVNWKDDSISAFDDVENDIEFVQIPKPEGYDNSYEEFYGEAGIFWPLPGTKIRYKGTDTFWFTDIIKNAENNLEVGKEYTIKSISPASSWCEVKVEKFPEISLSLSFFEYD